MKQKTSPCTFSPLKAFPFTNSSLLAFLFQASGNGQTLLAPKCRCESDLKCSSTQGQRRKLMLKMSMKGGSNFPSHLLQPVGWLGHSPVTQLEFTTACKVLMVPTWKKGTGHWSELGKRLLGVETSLNESVGTNMPQEGGFVLSISGFITKGKTILFRRCCTVTSASTDNWSGVHILQ